MGPYQKIITIVQIVAEALKRLNYAKLMSMNLFVMIVLKNNLT